MGLCIVDCLFGSGVDCIGHSRGQKWTIWAIFFANLTNYISPDGEFCFCHLVFGVFCPQIHVFWGPITNFRKWGLLIASNPHFRKFVNTVGTLSAEGGRRQLANFWKWGLLAISNPHFRKFASCHCTSIRVNFSTQEAEVFSSMCLVWFPNPLAAGSGFGKEGVKTRFFFFDSRFLSQKWSKT